MIVYNSLTNSVIESFRGVENYVTGVTASIVQGDPSFDNYLYIGGHIAVDYSNLAIFRYDYATRTTTINEIMYSKYGGDFATALENLNFRA